jgi:hypothetical protein
VDPLLRQQYITFKKPTFHLQRNRIDPAFCCFFGFWIVFLWLSIFVHKLCCVPAAPSHTDGNAMGYHNASKNLAGKLAGLVRLEYLWRSIYL